MPTRRILHVGPDEQLARVIDAGIARIQTEMGLSAEFPAEVLAQAQSAATAFQPTDHFQEAGQSQATGEDQPNGPSLWRAGAFPDWLATTTWADFTHLPLVTIDPASSMDLDQALYIEQLSATKAHSGAYYRVWYAIADVAAFIEPGSALDEQAMLRGQTLYGADSKIPLHPFPLSEGAGSLLPDTIRPALLWRHDLDSEGKLLGTDLERAIIRSQAKFSYAQVQHFLGGGDLEVLSMSSNFERDEIHASLHLLATVGGLRVDAEVARGGVYLPSPEQELIQEGDRWVLKFRNNLPVEDFNAQISLLTGFAAAELMLDAGIGVIRTLPAPEHRAISALREVASGLDITWPDDVDYPAFIRSLNPALPTHAAMLDAAPSLLRGSRYAAFDGEKPDESFHAGVGSEYAHVTAPLRRLVDRFALEVCVALSAGVPVPEWVLTQLPHLPQIMARSGQQASQYFRHIVDLVEAGLLQHRVGETFLATIIDRSGKNGDRGVVIIPDPAVEAPVYGNSELPLGQRVRVLLEEADPQTRKVKFSVAS